MRILRRGWNIEYNAVLFEVEDGQDKYVCSITENRLDPENSHHQMDEKIANDIFDSKIKEIEAAAATVIADARARGIKHKPGQYNEPLPI